MVARRSRVSGDRELKKVFFELPNAMQRRASRKALRAGGRVFIKRMKPRIPKKTGALRRSPRFSTTKPGARRGRRDQVFGFIGFKPPESRIAHLVEFGTSHSAAVAFVRNTIDSDGREVIVTIGAAMGEGLSIEAGKLAGRFGKIPRSARRRL